MTEPGCDHRVFDVTFMLPVSYRIMADDEAQAVEMAKKAFVGKLLVPTATGLPRGEPEVREVEGILATDGERWVFHDGIEAKEVRDGRQE